MVKETVVEWDFCMVVGRARLGLYGQILFVGEWRVARP